jgi:hypothetical protein
MAPGADVTGVAREMHVLRALLSGLSAGGSRRRRRRRRRRRSRADPRRGRCSGGRTLRGRFPRPGAATSRRALRRWSAWRSARTCGRRRSFSRRGSSGVSGVCSIDSGSRSAGNGLVAFGLRFSPTRRPSPLCAARRRRRRRRDRHRRRFRSRRQHSCPANWHLRAAGPRLRGNVRRRGSGSSRCDSRGICRRPRASPTPAPGDRPLACTPCHRGRGKEGVWLFRLVRSPSHFRGRARSGQVEWQPHHIGQAAETPASLFFIYKVEENRKMEHRPSFGGSGGVGRSNE